MTDINHLDEKLVAQVWRAAERGDAAWIASFLAENPAYVWVRSCEQGRLYWSLAHHAAAMGDAALMKTVLDIEPELAVGRDFYRASPLVTLVGFMNLHPEQDEQNRRRMEVLDLVLERNPEAGQILDWFGESATYRAAEYRLEAAFRKLFACEKKGNQFSVAHMAAARGDIKVLEWLGEKEPGLLSLRNRDELGETPWHVAVRHGCLDVLRLMPADGFADKTLLKLLKDKARKQEPAVYDRRHMDAPKPYR